VEKIDQHNPLPYSGDLLETNIRTLAELFPGLVTEGANGAVLNVDLLKQLVGDRTVTDTEEKFGLGWYGKRRARQQALTPSVGTLLPCPQASVEWEATQHMFIEGDNLEVLKLLQKSYAGKVKLIYIDPPYNTGNDLLYPNDFHDPIKTYLEVTGQAEGGAKLVSNPEGSGRYHTNWLNMMYPRLLLARNLLRREDGVLICTIDEHEQTNLGAVLKEVFNEGSYEHTCVTIVHNPRGVQGTNFSYTHEYAFFVYPRGTKAIGDRKIPEDAVSWSQFRNWGSESERTDAKNCFYPVLVRAGRILGFGDVCPDDVHPQQTEWDGDTALVYPIDRSGTERKWRYARQSVEAVAHLLRAKETGVGYEIEIGKDFGQYKTVWVDKRYDANEYGTGIVGTLVPDSPFTFPKSLWAVYDCLYAAVGNDRHALVLDFFAGSGTTGHAVYEMNRNDGGSRRFILVQLPEPIADSPYATIA
jgi:adenine-specific DNA-methyltransferase